MDWRMEKSTGFYWEFPWREMLTVSKRGKKMEIGLDKMYLETPKDSMLDTQKEMC